MRGELMKKILNVLKDITLSQVDLLEAIIASGYGASSGKINYTYKKIREERYISEIEYAEFLETKKKIQQYLYNLKKDGLIVKIDNNKVKISEKGKEKLASLDKIFDIKKLPKEISNILIIVTFDIPEDQRSDRDWFRSILRFLDFKMVHKSVWLGKVKIPKQLILEMGKRGILDFVEIFEISKSGTLLKLK
ncbi:hypothetical protein A3A09_03635 [Candidatus Nomurabacteria bacterium RIFCSPLOWO2_01_FULL_42_20]|uniref:Transcriptional repressor PaaX-like central Cas2-like domain-containing protein n=1 Tax=Candidatus Nomurabacteria bacterium RIFCSPHIGHO2_01_FULL_42_16 TaxID=1801743 RepID=A0A1F6VHD7_9BACT|nr:MAG: hypothetical protein A2824_02965 [Candidatus Nomurabacteria bacterium RIFCSPHIGHO2_01_FULL_42_16]OGI92073.1 MAG: hypothetical protein A3A09_03635 [Candidatus Nomurabacteria bacterium RIFCSPLOWO2_01_FULL_42_20]